jgi:DNA-binding MarR family transcriptional regulator
MQLLQKSTDGASSAGRCARALLDGVPPVMQFLREVAHRQKARGLSVQQFRAMAYLRRRPGDSLSQVAEHLGLSRPAASRMIDMLVSRRLVQRQAIPHNRRQIQLTLSSAGSMLLENAIQAVLVALEQRLKRLSRARRKRIISAIEDLRELFEPAISDRSSS